MEKIFFIAQQFLKYPVRYLDNEALLLRDSIRRGVAEAILATYYRKSSFGGYMPFPSYYFFFALLEPPTLFFPLLVSGGDILSILFFPFFALLSPTPIHRDSAKPHLTGRVLDPYTRQFQMSHVGHRHASASTSEFRVDVFLIITLFSYIYTITVPLSQIFFQE